MPPPNPGALSIAFAEPHITLPESTSTLEPMTYLPGGSFFPTPQNNWLTGLDIFTTPQMPDPQVHSSPGYLSHPISSFHHDFFASVPPIEQPSIMPPTALPPSALPPLIAPPSALPLSSAPIALDRGGPFRPSMYELKPQLTPAPMNFQTTIFQK